MLIVPCNWSELQHYKDRSPPWIKLHKKLLDNFEFHCLPVASRALAPMLWLLASEHEDGEIDATPERLAFRLRMSEEDAKSALRPLIDKSFFLLVQGDSSVLAECKQDAMPEAEAEREAEGEKTPRRAARPLAPDAKKPKAVKTGMPEDFGVSERVTTWATQKGYGQLQEHLEAFKRKASANGYRYADWDAAFMEAIREDWAKLRGRTPNGAAPPATSPIGRHTDSYEETQRLLAERNRGATGMPAEVRQFAAHLTGRKAA